MIPHTSAAEAEERDPRGASAPHEELEQGQDARASRSAPAAGQRGPQRRDRVQLYQYGRAPYQPAFVPVRTPPERHKMPAESHESLDSRDSRKVAQTSNDESRRSRHGQRSATPRREGRREGHSTRHSTRHSTGRTTMMEMNGMAVLIATCAILCCLAVMCLSFNLGVATGAGRARAASRM